MRLFLYDLKKKTETPIENSVIYKQDLPADGNYTIAVDFERSDFKGSVYFEIPKKGSVIENWSKYFVFGDGRPAPLSDGTNEVKYELWSEKKKEGTLLEKGKILITLLAVNKPENPSTPPSNSPAPSDPNNSPPEKKVAPFFIGPKDEGRIFDGGIYLAGTNVLIGKSVIDCSDSSTNIGILLKKAKNVIIKNYKFKGKSQHTGIHIKEGSNKVSLFGIDTDEDNMHGELIQISENSSSVLMDVPTCKGSIGRYLIYVKDANDIKITNPYVGVGSKTETCIRTMENVSNFSIIGGYLRNKYKKGSALRCQGSGDNYLFKGLTVSEGYAAAFPMTEDDGGQKETDPKKRQELLSRKMRNVVFEDCIIEGSLQYGPNVEGFEFRKGTVVGIVSDMNVEGRVVSKLVSEYPTKDNLKDPSEARTLYKGKFVDSILVNKAKDGFLAPGGSDGPFDYVNCKDEAGKPVGNDSKPSPIVRKAFIRGAVGFLGQNADKSDELLLAAGFTADLRVWATITKDSKDKEPYRIYKKSEIDGSVQKINNQISRGTQVLPAFNFVERTPRDKYPSPEEIENFTSEYLKNFVGKFIEAPNEPDLSQYWATKNLQDYVKNVLKPIRRAIDASGKKVLLIAPALGNQADFLKNLPIWKDTGVEEVAHAVNIHVYDSNFEGLKKKVMAFVSTFPDSKRFSTEWQVGKSHNQWLREFPPSLKLMDEYMEGHYFYRLCIHPDEKIQFDDWSPYTEELDGTPNKDQLKLVKEFYMSSN